MEYFIIDENNKQAGPFSPDQLAQKAITPETLVWTQGMADWTPAWKIAELKNVLEAAEAIRANQAAQNAGNFTAENAGNQVPPNYERTNFQQNYDNQQNYQRQNFQQDYQQPQQHPPRKKSGKTLWKLTLGLIVFIILLFAVTNPSAEAHKEKVSTEVGKLVDKATATTDNNFFTQGIRSIAKMMADNFMGQAMDQLFEYHNYIVCSKGTVTFDGKEHTVSFGILGKVYTMNADDMMKALQDDDNATGNTDGSDASDNTDDDEGSLGAKVQQKLEDKANEAIDKAADKVSKKVEEKINQKLNQPIDSSKVEKIIDKILDLI